jgi:hypothetical protein
VTGAFLLIRGQANDPQSAKRGATADRCLDTTSGSPQPEDHAK